MAIYIKNIPPFSASESHTFEFVYTGGNQAYRNRLVIKNDSTLETAYDKTIQTLQLNHTVEADTLENGNTYIAQVYVYDVEDILCATSETLQFKCLSDPIFEFNNVAENAVVKTSQYNFTLNYAQAEGEVLQEYTVMLYSFSKTLIYKTDVSYDVQTLVANISGLEDDTQYYVRATGVTVNGMEIDTGYILFTVDYITPSAFFLVELANINKQGAIQIRSNIITLEGTSDSDVVYLDNTYADLTDGNKVRFTEGYELPSSGSVIISGYGFKRNTTIATLSDKERSLQIEYKQGAYESVNGMESAFLKMYVNNKGYTYVLYSNYIDLPDPTDILSFCIVRQNGYYDIKLINVTDSTNLSETT